MKNKTLFLTLFAMVAASSVQAQELTSRIGVQASNTEFPASNGGLGFIEEEGYSSDSGSPLNASFSQSYTGLDDSGEERTMNISGQSFAQATYGSLRTSGSGTLSNSFYSESNDPYYNTTDDIYNVFGTPDIFNVYAQASWSDEILAGSTATNYWSTWIFRVTGNTSGQNAFSYFTGKVGNNAAENFYYGTPGPTNEVVRISKFIQGGIEENVRFDVFSTFQPQTQFYSTGANISGASSFGNTITLTGIELRENPNGPILTNVSMTGASGTVYNVVPEPATMGALALGLLGVLRRKRVA